MRCEHCRQLLDEHVEKLLLPLDRASVDAHLAGCDRCSVEAGRLRALVDALADLPDVEVPADFTETVMANLPEMLPAREGAGHLVRWGLVSAVSFLAFVAGIALLPQLGGPEVARDTLGPLSATFQLGGMLLSHAAAALGRALDASASELAAAGVAAKLGFAAVFVACNAALALSVHRYRDPWLRQPSGDTRSDLAG